MDKRNYLILVDTLGVETMAEVAASDWLGLCRLLAPYPLEILAKVSWDLTYRDGERIRTLGVYRLIYCDFPSPVVYRKMRARFDFKRAGQDMEEMILSLIPAVLDRSRVEVYSPTFHKKYWASQRQESTKTNPDKKLTSCRNDL